MITGSHAKLKKTTPHMTCLYVTAVNRIGRIFVVKDMQQSLGDESQIELRQDKVTNIQRISTLRKQNNKGEKEPENFSNYFRGILCKNGILSIITILKNLEI